MCFKPLIAVVVIVVMVVRYYICHNDAHSTPPVRMRYVRHKKNLKPKDQIDRRFLLGPAV